jgi:hypothetical protein
MSDESRAPDQTGLGAVAVDQIERTAMAQITAQHRDGPNVTRARVMADGNGRRMKVTLFS